jgi:hypothetical protein
MVLSRHRCRHRHVLNGTPVVAEHSAWVRTGRCRHLAILREAGLVTDVISTRTDALRLLGNSVCPPQAALALELLDE